MSMKGKKISKDGANRLFRLSVIIPLLVFCCIAVLPASVRAADSGYDITAYNVDIKVGADNVFHVTETITVNFRQASHGIYRYIPYRQVMDWNNGGVSRRIVYNTPVTSVSVFSDSYQLSRQDGNVVIKIGDAGKLISGKKVYKISYDHMLGNDQIATQDFVYYNIIGTNWNCAISNVTFNITMPKSFDANKLWFFSGPAGSTASTPVQFLINGNTISGTLGKSLKPGEALTIQMDLPEGYFTIPKEFPWQQIIILAAVFVAVLALVLFLRFGRDDFIVKPVEFYPPDNITSAEAGYVIDTIVDDRDVVSLILYWASKGYLTIEQLEKDDFRLAKIKDLPELPNKYEKYLFSEIFKNRDSVLISELRQKTYAHISETKTMIKAHYAEKERLLYSKKSSALGNLVLLLSGLIVFGSIFKTIYVVYFSVTFTLAFSLIATIVVFMPIVYIKSVAYRWNVMGGIKKTAMLFLGVLLSAAVMFAYFFYMSQQGMFFAGIVVAAATLFTGIISIFMRKRTPYGNQLYGKILGFRNFLNLAEKERLERLVEENPSYFYDVMPYAYALGVSDKWAKKFEDIAMPPPSWYNYGQAGAFNSFLFYNMMFRSMNTMRAAMTTPPIQTGKGGFGGGGFGGGGFSGGGFGGGGGGRW